MACAESLYERGEINSAALHWKAAAEIGRNSARGVTLNADTSDRLRVLVR
jgi:hypothetical protein